MSPLIIVFFVHPRFASDGDQEWHKSMLTPSVLQAQLPVIGLLIRLILLLVVWFIVTIAR